MTTTPPPDPTPDHANLRRLAESATPGPWANAGYYSDESIGPHIAGPGDVEIAIVVSDREDADAAYIAAANPQAVLGLLDTIDRLRAENEGLRARIGRTDITRDAYETLIADDGAWLLSHPRTVERDHILAVLTWSIGALYGNDRVPTLPTDRSPK